MGKAKGKVNEKSLDALKKSIKAGGKTRQSNEAKPATPKALTIQPRSRSRSRTPTRANKTSLPPKEKKVQPKKPTPTPKVKRLTDEKSASKRPRLVEDQSAPKRSRGRPSNSTKFPGSYKLRPRIQPSEDEITSSTRTIEESPESFSDSSVTVVKGKTQISTTSVEANRGWFSKCVIS